MIRKRPPQGTFRVVDLDKQERISKAIADHLDEEMDARRADPDINALANALRSRNDREAGRLIKVVKARYPKEWPFIAAAIGRVPLKSVEVRRAIDQLAKEDQRKR